MPSFAERYECLLSAGSATWSQKNLARNKISLAVEFCEVREQTSSWTKVQWAF
jgi:hypothetical protein